MKLCIRRAGIVPVALRSRGLACLFRASFKSGMKSYVYVE